MGNEASMQAGRSRKLVTLALLLSTFLAAIEVTVVSTAMPKIVADLGGLSLISWVYAAYLLTTAISTPLFGKMADLYGRKNIFIIGSALFVGGSMLCGLSGTMTQMIIFRALQGIGAGAVMPVTFTMVADIYTYEERAKIQGLFSSIWGIAGLVGPLVGGFFVDSLSWHWIFYFNVPFGIVSVWMIMVCFHEKVERKDKPVDYAGAATFSIGMTAFLFAIITGGQGIAWNSPWMFTLFGTAAVFLALFFRIEVKAKEPMVPLKLFRIRDIGVSNLVSFLASAIVMGISSYMPLWTQGVLGQNASSSGLSLTPMSIGWLIGSIIGGRMLIKIGARVTSTLGMILIVIASIWLATISDTTPLILIVIIMSLSGLGFGLSFTVFTVIVQSSVDWSMRGASTALNTFVRSLGQMLGIAAFGTFLNASIATMVSDAGPDVSSRVSNEDLSKLLNPESASSLSPDLMGTLRSFLETGLGQVFLLMAIIAVACLVSMLFMPKSTKSGESSGHDEASSPSH